jgi:transposase
MDILFVFLVEGGVEPTNNLAERTIRLGVLWRKRSISEVPSRYEGAVV